MRTDALTLLLKFHRSLVAPTTNVYGMPTEIRFEAHQLPSGRAGTIPVYTYEQLESSSFDSLYLKARNLVDKIGPDALPPLTKAGGAKKVIAYIIDVQISLCRTIGLGVAPMHFGCPDGWNTGDDEGYFGGDGYDALHVDNYTKANMNKQMHELQPAHRGLQSFQEHADMNHDDARNGYEASKRRNAGSIHLG